MKLKLCILSLAVFSLAGCAGLDHKPAGCEDTGHVRTTMQNTLVDMGNGQISVMQAPKLERRYICPVTGVTWS